MHCAPKGKILNLGLINGVYYKKMIDFMINEIGFDKKQLNQMYKNRTCHLFIHDILKEKASGIHKMNYKTMYLCTRKYVKAWVMVYPCMFVPSFISITVYFCLM